MDDLKQEDMKEQPGGGGIIKTSMFGILISFITHIFGKGTY